MAMPSSSKQAVVSALLGNQSHQPTSPFVWGSGGQALNPAQVKSRQAIVDALLSQNQSTPTTFGEGIAQLGRAGIAAWQRGQIEEAETAGRSEAQAVMDMLLGNENPTSNDILSAAANPWVADNPAYAPIINALISRDERNALHARQDALLADERAQPDWQTIKDGNGDYFRYDANDPNSVPEMWFDAPELTGASADGQLGTTIYTGRDENGNIVPMQVGQGGFVQSTLPPGITFDPGALNAERAYGTRIGAGQGDAVVAAPEAIATAQRTLSQIQDLKSDPGLWWSTGNLGWTPNVPGNPQAGTISRIEQLQGAAFLEAFESLKGGGQITEIEGTKATNAIARLQRSQSYEEFVDALGEIEEVVQIGLERAQRQAQGGAPMPQFGGAGTGAPAGPGIGDDPLGLF